ncbi:regulator of G-protein signaling domain-containing protein [Candidatus Uabimicrobium sp. HlEnr_7]|uniref:regulator of G-protein signaling domain-containing protein n=1 Tax=Candidatus Uabimicrobium helgolandensis TaxID=3095367 RepID=UPI00355619CB
MYNIGKYKIGTFLLIIALLATTIEAKSKERKTWNKAKKKAEKQFKEFHSTVSKSVKKKKDRKQLLKECGLKSNKLSKHIKFDLDFGPTLDTLANLKDKLRKAKKERLGMKKEDLEKLLEAKKLKNEFNDFLVKELSQENILFYLESKKKKGPYLYEKYVSNEAELIINLPHTTRQQWDNIAQNDQWKSDDYKKALETAQKDIFKLMYTDSYTRFLSKYSGAKKVKSLEKEIKTTKKDLRKIIKKYKKKIEDLDEEVQEGFTWLIENRVSIDVLEFDQTLIETLDEIRLVVKK